MQRLVDGPFPAWMITASIAATILTDHSSRDRRTESSHDDAGVFLAHALQPHASLHRFWCDLLYGFQHGRRVDFAPLRCAILAFHRGERGLHTPGPLRLFHDGDVWINVLHRAAARRPRMALRVADQAAFLGVGLWRWTDVVDAARRAALVQGPSSE